MNLIKYLNKKIENFDYYKMILIKWLYKEKSIKIEKLIWWVSLKYIKCNLKKVKGKKNKNWSK